LGQNNPLEISRPAAVVNGQAGDGVESWTIGYTPELVTVVNLHRNDRQPMSLSPWTMEGAGTVWRAVMDYLTTRDAIPPPTGSALR
jgi:membrane peptidoglycan carboxypeptidase